MIRMDDFYAKNGSDGTDATGSETHLSENGILFVEFCSNNDHHAVTQNCSSLIDRFTRPREYLMTALPKIKTVIKSEPS